MSTAGQALGPSPHKDSLRVPPDGDGAGYGASLCYHGVLVIARATRLLLISHYELTGLRGLMECVAALDDADNPLADRAALILNNTRMRPALRAAEFERRVNLRVRSQLPYADDLPSVAARDGIPLVEIKPQAALSRELSALAEGLTAVPAASPSSRR